MIGGVQKKILLTQDEKGNLRMDDEMGKLCYLVTLTQIKTTS
jgi:hypothetical protein